MSMDSGVMHFIRELWRMGKQQIRNKEEMLTRRKIVWRQDFKEKKHFYSLEFNQSTTWLRLNNFPEEPLWTFFHQGTETDLEDTPKKWKIIYLKEFR